MEGMLYNQEKGDQPIENQLRACKEYLTNKACQITQWELSGSSESSVWDVSLIKLKHLRSVLN